MCSWLCLDLKAFRFRNPFRAISSLLLLLVRLISLSVIFREVARHPRSQRSKTLLRDDIRKTGQLLLICNKNLFPNNGRCSCICVRFFFFFALAQGASPPTVLRCTICVLQSEMSHTLCIRDSYGKKKKRNIYFARAQTG